MSFGTLDNPASFPSGDGSSSNVVALFGKDAALPNTARTLTRCTIRPHDLGIMQVARRFHINHLEMRSIITHIRAQVEHCGFPAPASPRLIHGIPVMQGPKAVHRHSRWSLDEVEAWFEQTTPPSTAAALAAREQDAMRATLAARAGQMGGKA